MGIAMKHHVEMENLDYIQIHPTTLYSKKPGRRFLVSESVRGEGALLYDKNGQRFTNELQPRDLLSQKIFAQMEKDGTEFVWEDMRPLGEKTILEHFPHIYEQCVEEGFDPRKEPIPVVLAQHYFMGGMSKGKFWESKNFHKGLLRVERQVVMVFMEETVWQVIRCFEKSRFLRKRAAKDLVAHYETVAKLPESLSELDLEDYQDQESLEEDYKKMVLEKLTEQNQLASCTV